MPQTQFDKDFGYLIPFLDKVAAAAAGLSDPAARTELTALMTDEKARWARIRSLLGGAVGQTSTGSVKENSVGATTGRTVETSQEAARRTEPRFTVGSLRQR